MLVIGSKKSHKWQVISHQKKPVLRTPTHDSRLTIHGFTLVEVCVSSAILAIGVLMIFQSFFIVADLYQRHADMMVLAPKTHEKMWDIENSLTRIGMVAETILTQGTFDINGRPYSWNASYRSLGGQLPLYLIQMNVSGQSGRKAIHLKRTVYTFYREPE